MNSKHIPTILIISQTILIIYLIFRSDIFLAKSEEEKQSLINSELQLLEQSSIILKEDAKIKELSSSSCVTKPRSELIEEFRKIASEAGTDKVNSHTYHNLYGTHFSQYRDKKINLLEIGLGCNMGYGPGKSLIVWRKYFTHPETRVNVLEYDRPCAEKFRPPITNGLYIGDQANFTLLEIVGSESGPYDIIIDDGGHFRSHMVRFKIFISLIWSLLYLLTYKKYIK